ncbi:uncharacterized protein LOC117340096 [Pecten maximus]|uniref:uncharacterized protein LOC117340096 n=1 Tax=Pecten maximus TaxID=6579 RepID=UPI001458D723|nr:uncharacterized protein LOC117340096 [Pecten maximus]
MSFSYERNSGLCTISNMSSSILPAGYEEFVMSNDVTLFQRTRGEVSVLFEKWPYSSLPRPSSYKTILQNISLDACAEECTRNTYFQCQSFGFSSVRKNCYLSDTRAGQEGGRLDYHDALDHYEYRRNGTMLQCSHFVPL